MARISPDQIGLRDAADVFGVSIDTLRRRIRDNQLDEALLVQGPFGATWVLPKAELGTIAEREGWDHAGDSTPPVSRVAPSTQSPGHSPASEATPPPPEPPGLPNSGQSSVIDLTDSLAESPSVPSVAVEQPPAPILVAAEAVAEDSPTGPDVTANPDELVRQVSDVVAEEIARGLSDNVYAELAAVREAITAAEVKAVAADARTDALRSEKGRLEAQLKRAEADIEYWRSQHDRLDKDLDRERNLRVTSDKAKAVAESETRVVRERVEALVTEVEVTRERERSLIAIEASLQAELDQATMAMGWWSRRRLTKLQARSSGRTPPPPAGD